MNIIEELKQRGLYYDCTDEEALTAHLSDDAPVTFYAGFDPTADSLHVGTLLVIMTMVRLQRAGHRPIAVVGGGTGMIGDPSGKSKERQLLDEQTIEHNITGIKAQLSRFLDMEDSRVGAMVVNNYDWLGRLSFIEFLRDVGKHFTVNSMIAKESVRQRLENREQGISYTEFSYMLLQAYDFAHLNAHEGCTLQIGGSDQWGNITAGIDLIRRRGGKPSYGLTIPLLTTSSGHKFGKTEAGTVWLDSRRTSPYQFYQFWIRTEDADVIRFLRMFTFLPMEEIDELASEHESRPEARVAHRKLAEEMTRMVHGQEGLEAAQRATQALFGGSLEGLSAADLLDIFAHVPSGTIASGDLAQGMMLPDLMVKVGFTKSKGEARRLIKGGGLYLNNQRVTSQDAKVTSDDLLDGSVMVLRSGKKRYHLVKVQ